MSSEPGSVSDVPPHLVRTVRIVCIVGVLLLLAVVVTAGFLQTVLRNVEREHTAHNMRQVFRAVCVYAETAGATPYWGDPAVVSGYPVLGTGYAQVRNRIFVHLARWSQPQLEAVLFVDLQRARKGSGRLSYRYGPGGASSPQGPVDFAGPGDGIGIGFAYDYTVPLAGLKNPQRVILTSLSDTERQRGGALITFGDEGRSLIHQRTDGRLRHPSQPRDDLHAADDGEIEPQGWDWRPGSVTAAWCRGD